VANVTDALLGNTDGHAEFVAGGNPASNPGGQLVVNDSGTAYPGNGLGLTKNATTTFTVAPALTPPASITVKLASSQPAATISPASMTFTTTTPQTATVTGATGGDTIVSVESQGYRGVHLPFQVRG
jgi:hypothetical protein